MGLSTSIRTWLVRKLIGKLFREPTQFITGLMVRHGHRDSCVPQKGIDNPNLSLAAKALGIRWPVLRYFCGKERSYLKEEGYFDDINYQRHEINIL